MNDVGKIKFGEQSFDLVPDGVILGESDGTIVFQRGDMTFDEIKAILQNNAEITQIGASGTPEWIRSDLVYAGKMTEQSGYTVNTKQTMTGENEYMAVDVKADVMIADFRKPNLQEQLASTQEQLSTTQEQLASTNAKLSYLSMMTGIDIEGAEA